MFKSLKGRLYIIGLFPIMLLFSLSGYVLYDSYNKYSKDLTLKTQLKVDGLLSDLMTEFAKERGMSAIYLGSKGRIIKDNLGVQREKTDKAYDALIKYIATEPLVHQSLQGLLKSMGKKALIREQVDKFEISFEDAFFGYYTNQVNRPIIKYIKESLAYSFDVKLMSNLSILTDLIETKDNVGLERGFISYVLSRYIPMSDEYIHIWNDLISKSTIPNFDSLINKDLKRRVEVTLEDDKYKQVFANLDKERVKIQRNMGDGLYDVDPAFWFNLQTKKIDVLLAVEKTLKADVISDSMQSGNNLFFILIGALVLWVLSVILAVIGYFLSSDITENITSLEDIIAKVAMSEALSEDIDNSLKDKINLNSSSGIQTAYQLLEKTLEKAEVSKVSAEESSKAKSMFLANMSHEIRTPLNGIIGFTELLGSSELTSEQKEFVNIIQKSSENLLEIINSILDLSKIESNKIEIENVVFKPMEEFESAVDVYAPRASEKNIDLSIFIDPQLSNPLKGDPTKIKEVIINLISNSIKFTNSGGAITILIKKVSKEYDKARVYFEVQDTGIGIPADKKAHIFEAFSQADTSVTRKYGGTGLGLTISSEFIRMMGGQLDLDSDLGKGSKFFFTIELEEVPSLEESLENKYKDMQVGFLEVPNLKKVQNDFIKKYLDYLGVKMVKFDEFDKLVSSKEKFDFSILDFVYLDGNKMKTLQHKSISTALILKSSLHRKESELGKYTFKILYEPVSFTKVCATVEGYLDSKNVGVKKPEVVDKSKLKFNARALVVEDNQINQKLILKTLSDLGLNVDLANNGLEAFEKRKSNDYEIVFMDIQMPIMDGVEATREILEYEEDMNVPHIPIIALTAHALKGDREKYLNAGMDEYITKPLVREEIINILEHFLSDKISVEKQSANNQEEAPKEEKARVRIEDVEEPKPVRDEPKEEMIELEPIQEAPKEVKADILIAKKSALESKIFAKMVEALGHSYEISKDFDDLKMRILQDTYKVVVIDRELGGLNLEQIHSLLDSNFTKILLFVDPKKELNPADKEFVSDVVKNIIKKDLIKLILKKYMK